MALKRIMLRDFVIVQMLDLELDKGFTALTGETGAGKSILVDALQITLGARTESGLVREGAKRTEVSAEFDCTAALHPWLEEAGFDISDTLLLRRTVDVHGKSRAWINGSAATAAQLRHLGEQLLDIHGQHAWQSLTRPDAVRALLDAYAGVSNQKINQHWNQWRLTIKKLEQARAAQDTLLRERERLQWQIAEVEKLAPAEDEWEELNTQHTRLTHAQSLLEAAQEALEELHTEESGVSQRLGRANHLLSNLTHLEPEFQELSNTLVLSLTQTQETARALQSYLRRTEMDPTKLDELDSRVGLWLSLARRYKRAPSQLHELLQSWRHELHLLNEATDLAALEAEERQNAKNYFETAQSLSHARHQAAPLLSRVVTDAMQELGMAGGQFEVTIEQSAESTNSGTDEVIFRVAGHAGVSLRPIAKVASGGELSRISLAIAVATSSLGNAATLIFDEVDSGVGGAVAEAVGRMMQQLGKDRQVLAVTHLAQMAACADQHLVVEKMQKSQGVFSIVTPVRHHKRVAEVARMLGGERISATSLAHAGEMLKLANTKDSQG